MQRRAAMREIRAQISNGDASSCMSAEDGIALFRSGSFDLSHKPALSEVDSLLIDPVENLKNTKLRILVVDDSRLNRKMLIKCFTSDGKHHNTILYPRLIAILRVT